ncbi:MAG: amino acid adenylation domain-containing protein [Oscillospiraceae bacterium]|nr:amino acid adenylation domain-containing protein [Oscillospiraceae bacterium]
MLTNVLEYLEQTVTRLPDKVAFANEEMGLSFCQVYNQARAIGTHLHNEGFYKKPVVVFMKKHPKTIVAFLGTIYSGCYYVPLDEEMPRHRIELIFQTLQPGAIICDDTTAPLVQDFDYNGKTYLYDDICTTAVDDAALAEIRNRQIDTDPIYIVFTSGSTGIPKGVMACHRSVLDYIEHLSEVLKFNEDTVFGNQTPLYFDACLKEIYPTMKYGATTYIVPKQLFMFPIKLVEFLNQFKINTVCWVVSALTMISAFKTFDKVKPEYLHTIAFASEVFPIKQFKIWKENLPNARFINLYGPTEVTGICCYYEVDREFSLEESLPIGRPFKNTDIILLDENDKEPAPGEQGEICVRGTSLTLGYYRNPEKTSEAFVQNPLNDMYPELIYRTGDLGKYNERGELVFLSRKDFQIKHMGHRIELGEIEVIVNMHPEAETACCIFDNEKKKIVLYYVGNVDVKDMAGYIKEKLPRYMVPNVIKQLPQMPLTPNGKINRNLLKQQYEQGNN